MKWNLIRTKGIQVYLKQILRYDWSKQERTEFMIQETPSKVKLVDTENQRTW